MKIVPCQGCGVDLEYDPREVVQNCYHCDLVALSAPAIHQPVTQLRVIMPPQNLFREIREPNGDLMFTFGDKLGLVVMGAMMLAIIGVAIVAMGDYFTLMNLLSK